MRELSSEPLSNDAYTVYVVAEQWTCPSCVTDGGDPDWISQIGGPF